MGCISLLLSILLLHTTQARIKVQLFSGTAFEQIPDIFPYTSSTTIYYKVNFTSSFKIPTLNDTAPTCPTNTSLSDLPAPNSLTPYQRVMTIAAYKRQCRIKHDLQILLHKLNQQMLTEQISFTTSTDYSSRNKRALNFIGSFFSWCCGLVDQSKIKGIVQNEEDITKHTNNLIDMVSDEHANLITTSHQLNNFTKDVTSFSDKVHAAVQLLQQEISQVSRSPADAQLLNLLELTWTYLYFNAFYDNLRQLQHQCSSYILPQSLISSETLLHDLQKLEETSKQYELSLAIPTSKLHLYTQLPLTTCTFFQNHILVSIKIPLLRKMTIQAAYFNIPTPLHWDDRICFLSSQKTIIIKTDVDIYTIDPDNPYCSKDTLPLCLLPRFTTQASPSHQCLSSILTSQDINAIRSACHFTCYPEHNHPIITQLKPNSFLITNLVYPLTLTCPENSTTIPSRHVGTIELDLPCNCSVNDNVSMLISPIIPCDSRDHLSFKITHLLPITWTTFTSITIFPIDSPIRHTFHNASEILDQNWTIVAPTFYVNDSIKQGALTHFELRNTFDDIMNNTSLLVYICLGWTFILTILTLLLAYCLHMQYFRLLAFTTVPAHPATRPLPNLPANI